MGGVVDIIEDVVDAVVNIVEAVVDVVGSVVSALFGWLSPSIPQYDNPEAFDSYNQGTMVNKQSNVANIPVVYGRRRVGGTRVFVASAGENNKYLYVCLAVAEGPIDAFEKLYINDEEIPLDALTHGTQRSPLSGRFKDRMIVQCFDGRDNQTASSLLKEAPGWGNNHRLRGVAYVAARFEWKKATQQELEDQVNSNPYSGIPEINVLIRGRKVVDLTTITPASYTGTYAQNRVWSQNPVNCLADYLRDPRYGKALDNDSINFERFKEAALVCDEQKSFSGGSDDFLHCDLTVDTNQRMFDNTKALLECCRGYLPYQEGKYACYIETGVSDTSNLFVINDDIIIGELSVSSEDKNTKFNKCELTFSNLDKNYESDTIIFTNNTYLTEDSGEELKKTHSSPGISTRKRAYDQARLIVDRSRKQKQVSVKCSAEAQNIQPGDIVKLTHKLTEFPAADSDYMFKDKLMRVMGCEQVIDQTVRLVLVEHQNDIYEIQQPGEDSDLNANRIINPYVPDDDSDSDVVESGGSDQGGYTGPGDNISFTINSELRPPYGLFISFDYSGLSAFVDQLRVRIITNNNPVEYSIPVYSSANSNHAFNYIREVGTHDVRVYARTVSAGVKYHLIAEQQFTLTADQKFGTTNSVTSASAAEEGWS